MQDVLLGSIRFRVEHRNPGLEGGPTLRVFDAASGGRERLRFDCFGRGGHWHIDPAGRDEITPFDPDTDALAWLLDALRNDLTGVLRKAGLAPVADSAGAAAAYEAIERALRNPPLDLDAVRPSSRRPSRGEKWANYPEDVLPVWVADMDFPIAEPIRRVLRFAVERSDLGYPVHPAPTDLPEITARRMRERFAWSPSPDSVEILTDVVQGLFVALDRFSQPGEGAVVLTPIYPPFLASVRTMKRRLIECPLALGADGYSVDLDALRGAIDAGTRLLMLCNPHNPSGRVFTRSELEGLAAIAEQHDLVVVSDEIHADLTYPGRSHLPFASLSPEAAARCITLTAGSKAFNTAGLRCGVAIFGSPELKRRFNGLPRHLRGGIGLLGIEALRAAWTHGQPWLDQVLDYLAGNRQLVVDFVRDELPGVKLFPPEATYLAWLDCRELALEPSPYAHFLEHGRVALSDGSAFGEPGRGFARLNFATSRAILGDALERVAKSLR
ncbi:MAG: pyridoxal phosphate-dependent aminotransferase [Myxococcales bacterium]|nr:MAG: pyridoxal phosphate-dependent aminotransferase [Myxococcales bacterium]